MKRSARVKYLAGFVVSFVILLAVGSTLLSQLRHDSEGAKTLTRSPAAGDLGTNGSSNKAFKIVIDPGHGGKDPGSEGSGGQWEKDSNLALALKLYDLLKEDPMFEPRVTRSDDTFVELADRAAIANDWNADALISIHGNAYEDPSVAGTETYYTSTDSIRLAELIHGKVLEALGFPDRGVKEEKLKVLSLSRMPAILIEPGYLTNAGEEDTLLSEDGQRLAAKAVVDGLKQYFAG